MADEISRDEGVRKVVRPRFRMGLKPTALLRHAAKVRLALPLAQNDTGRVFAKCFPSFTPLSHGKPCQLCPVLPHSRCALGRSPLLQLLVARTSLRENAAPWRFLFAHPLGEVAAEPTERVKREHPLRAVPRVSPPRAKVKNKHQKPCTKPMRTRARERIAYA